MRPLKMVVILGLTLLHAPLRSTAAVVNLGSMAAMATSCLCLAFLIGILAARRPDPT